ncbi:uncharacterized protein LOC106094255 [Stomoxys calcitrans]|uniref:Single domain-containing protein n=1 Tax=Stomoxys calcitrans TaxID=35570 RepID=A0A1I8NSJ2_STOCA|nr:uncharacterized protein LOC106094255 [Stomoxys calcitrans]
MKLFCFALFMALFATGFASLLHGVFKDDAHPGKCVYKGLVLAPGEEGKVKGECLRVTCENADGLTELAGCPVQGVEPPCKLGDYVNLDAPYGECCKRQILCD